MKRILFTAILLFAASFTFAQKFSPEEYRHKFETYVAEKAELTKEESVRFFPLYQEMKDKQRMYFHEIRGITRRTDVANTSEASFRQLNDRITELNIEIEKVEQEYLQKFRKVISDRKYFLVRRAEASFQNQELRSTQQRKPN